MRRISPDCRPNRVPQGLKPARPEDCMPAGVMLRVQAADERPLLAHS